MYRVWDFVSTYSLLMVAGAVIALAWANIDPASHHALVEFVLWDHAPVGHAHHAPDGSVEHRTLTLHYLVNDVLMALFFAVAAKEVWEAVALRNGALRGAKAAVPLIATAGGMLGPVLVYLGLAAALGSETFDALARGWAIPTATDIAFSYIVARVIFGAGHPAIRFLLLLAIADDAGGLVIIAIFYPSGNLQPAWLLLSLGAALAAWLLANRLPFLLDRGDPARPWSRWARRTLSFWPYALAGAASWYGFQEAGLHPALGLLPIVPTIPHAESDFGVFADAEDARPDLLNTIEHGLQGPVQAILFLFGLLNAGVVVGASGAATWLVLAGLLLGKPLGILLAGWLAVRAVGLRLPEGMGLGDVLVVGCVAAVGFTVALFVAGVAFPAGASLGGAPLTEAAKLGALLSVLAAPMAWAAARATGVRRVA
jgi:NhaA family Na+:H+ antiporter